MKLTKISLPKDARDIFTLTMIDQSKRLAAQLAANNDSGKLDLTWEAEHLASYATQRSGVEIISARAEFAPNSTIEYNEETGYMDVWLDLVVADYDGFWRVRGYLTDVWQIHGNDDRELAQYMAIHHYIEEK